MRSLSTAAVSLFVAVFSVPTIAAGPLDGRWAFDAEICSNEPGSGDLIPTVIHDGKIDLYEEAGVKTPNDEPLVTRVLTIMLAEDW